LRRAGPLLALACFAAACGSSPQGEGLTLEQINALGLAKDEKAPRPPPPPNLFGLEPLSAADVAATGVTDGCGLSIGGQPILVANPTGAFVKREGAVARLTVDGPVGSAGGFFQSEALSISVGELPEDPNRAAPPPGSARARINDRRTGSSSELRADWTCGRVAAAG
jgi:hypothetical protein